LEILNEFNNYEAKEKDFFNALKTNESYLNEYYRVKKELLDYKLIAYKLDDNFNKVIFLTDKGKQVYEKLEGIEFLLTS